MRNPSKNVKLKLFWIPVLKFQIFLKNLISKTSLFNTSEQNLAIFVKKCVLGNFSNFLQKWMIKNASLHRECSSKLVFKHEISIKNYTRKVTEWLKIREKWRSGRSILLTTKSGNLAPVAGTREEEDHASIISLSSC